MTRKLGTVKDVAKALDIPVPRAYQLSRESMFPFLVKIGAKQYRYDLSRMEIWISEGGNVPSLGEVQDEKK